MTYVEFITFISVVFISSGITTFIVIRLIWEKYDKDTNIEDTS